MYNSLDNMFTQKYIKYYTVRVKQSVGFNYIFLNLMLVVFLLMLLTRH